MGCSRQVTASQQSELARAQFMAEISVHQCSFGSMKVDVIVVTAKEKMGTASEELHRDHRLFIRGKRYSTIPLVSTEGIHD